MRCCHHHCHQRCRGIRELLLCGPSSLAGSQTGPNFFDVVLSLTRSYQGLLNSYMMSRQEQRRVARPSNRLACGSLALPEDFEYRA